MRYWYLPDVPDGGTDIRLWAPTPVEPPAYRVLVPARGLSATEEKRLPDLRRLTDLLTAHEVFWTRTTYAMAEEIATATLIESVACRFEIPGGPAVAALWWDWRWHGAIVRELGTLTRERLELLITTGSAEVPLFACERCGREGLKRNKDQSLRAHRRLNWHPPYLEECR